MGYFKTQTCKKIELLEFVTRRNKENSEVPTRDDFGRDALEVFSQFVIETRIARCCSVQLPFSYFQEGVTIPETQPAE